MKIKRLKKSFGCNGVSVYDYILCEIYRVRGCFVEWDENTAFDVADYFGIKESLVNEIVNYCCAVGLFSKELLASERVLTSLSIQERYLAMCTRTNRQPKIPERVKITEDIPKSPSFDTKSLTFDNKSPSFGDKEEKSKPKKSKEEKNTARARGDFLPFSDDSQTMNEVKRLIPDERLVEEIRKFIESRYTTFHDTIDGISVCILIEDLLRHTPDTEKQIKSVKNAIAQRWKKFYPPNDDPPKGKRDKSTGTAPLSDLERYKKFQ